MKPADNFDFDAAYAETESKAKTKLNGQKSRNPRPNVAASAAVIRVVAGQLDDAVHEAHELLAAGSKLLFQYGGTWCGDPRRKDAL